MWYGKSLEPFVPLVERVLSQVGLFAHHELWFYLGANNSIPGAISKAFLSAGGDSLQETSDVEHLMIHMTGAGVSWQLRSEGELLSSKHRVFHQHAGPIKPVWI